MKKKTGNLKQNKAEEKTANGTSSDVSAKAGKGKKKKAGRGNALQVILILLIFLAGIGLILYPWFSDRWNQMHQSRAIMQYSRQIDNIDTEAYDKIIADARAYNDRLAYAALYEGYQIEGINDGLSQDAGTSEEDSAAESTEREGHAEYESYLNYDGTGMMGYISIPCIDVELPLYHGTSDAVLQTAIGHLEGSSLPVGGSGSHCVLSGHRGLPSAKLFTDLDQVQIGNIFTITVLNETLTYQVDRIDVVEPYDLSLLQIEDGQDYVTLVTCTPYGINTHRLLVRGTRVPNGTEDLVSSDQSSNHGEDSAAAASLIDNENTESSRNTVSEEELNANRLRDLGPRIAGSAIIFFAVVAGVSFIGRLVRHIKKKRQLKKERIREERGAEDGVDTAAPDDDPDSDKDKAKEDEASGLRDAEYPEDGDDEAYGEYDAYDEAYDKKDGYESEQDDFKEEYGDAEDEYPGEQDSGSAGLSDAEPYDDEAYDDESYSDKEAYDDKAYDAGTGRHGKNSRIRAAGSPDKEKGRRGGKKNKKNTAGKSRGGRIKEEYDKTEDESGIEILDSPTDVWNDDDGWDDDWY